MSRFGIGISIVAVALFAAFAAQPAGAQEPGQADAKSIQPTPPIPWLDPSLAAAPDRAKMPAISVATVHECSSGSSAICYGFCAPAPDHANREPATSRESSRIKQQTSVKGKPTDARTGNQALKTEN
jgi:hypothetical protein